MAETDVVQEAPKKAPTMEEIMAEQRRRLEEARRRMQEAAKDPSNHEPLTKGKGHEGGRCLKLG